MKYKLRLHIEARKTVTKINEKKLWDRTHKYMDQFLQINTQHEEIRPVYYFWTSEDKLILDVKKTIVRFPNADPRKQKKQIPERKY